MLLGTKKKQSRPIKGKGRGEPGDKEQMEGDESTEKQIKAMGCQNSKETVVEEKEKKLWNSKK